MEREFTRRFGGFEGEEWRIDCGGRVNLIGSSFCL